MNEELIERLRVDYPDIRFVSGKKYSFRPPRTIMIGPEESSLLLLHELGHALCGHRDFKTNIQRVKLEREAWEKARELSSKYGIQFDDEFAENELDTYRDWVEKKSRCPVCGLTRFQSIDGNYHCPRCNLN